MYQNPELNIEQEVFDLLFTDKDCSPIKTPYILKKYRRREDNNNRIECVCFLNNKFKEGIKDCPYCYGDGYLFDEFIIEGFMYFRQRASNNFNVPSEAGYADTESSFLITDSKTPVQAKDMVYQIELNATGQIHIPLIYSNKYLVVHSKKMKASRNSIDYNFITLSG
jgi:hypothetical protein